MLQWMSQKHQWHSLITTYQRDKTLSDERQVCLQLRSKHVWFQPTTSDTCSETGATNIAGLELRAPVCLVLALKALYNSLQCPYLGQLQIVRLTSNAIFLLLFAPAHTVLLDDQAKEHPQQRGFTTPTTTITPSRNYTSPSFFCY